MAALGSDAMHIELAGRLRVVCTVRDPGNSLRCLLQEQVRKHSPSGVWEDCMRLGLAGFHDNNSPVQTFTC